jgi:hypothetical protein
MSRAWSMKLVRASHNAGHLRGINRENQRNGAGETMEIRQLLYTSDAPFLPVLPLSDRHWG